MLQVYKYKRDDRLVGGGVEIWVVCDIPEDTVEGRKSVWRGYLKVLWAAGYKISIFRSLDKEDTVEYYSVTKKNKILPLAIMWIALEGMILTEISQSVKDKMPYDITHI